jgi:hypothetical protein
MLVALVVRVLPMVDIPVRKNTHTPANSDAEGGACVVITFAGEAVSVDA